MNESDGLWRLRRHVEDQKNVPQGEIWPSKEERISCELWSSSGVSRAGDEMWRILAGAGSVN